MSLSLASILQFHRERYPAMQPQDFGKLAYQSEFGPEHLVSDRTAVQQALFREWETLAPDVCAPAPDPLGNGLSRFHLDYRLGTASTVPLLADLVLRTAAAPHGSAAGLARRLDALSPLPIPGMAGWVAAYRAQGCPPPPPQRGVPRRLPAALPLASHLLRGLLPRPFVGTAADAERQTRYRCGRRPLRQRQNRLRTAPAGAVPLPRGTYG